MTTHELIERLNSHMGKQEVSVLLADCREAAQAISTLTAEVEELRALLRPFEEAAQHFTSNVHYGGAEKVFASIHVEALYRLKHRATLTKAEGTER